jgi:kynurenine formamidase
LNQRPERRAGLIVRTRANDERKLTRQYLDPVPPYFTTEAMEYIAQREVRHLVVDVPSIDRMFDAGRLSNHRIFWNVRQGSFETNTASRPECTITELAYVPNIVEDGPYLINLQIAPFESDASPSRPLLFRLSRN